MYFVNSFVLVGKFKSKLLHRSLTAKVRATAEFFLLLRREQDVISKTEPQDFVVAVWKRLVWALMSPVIILYLHFELKNHSF